MSLPAIERLKAAGPFWVCWKYKPAPDGGKPTKPPVSVRTGRIASHQSAAARGTFAEAKAAQARYTDLAGVGVSMDPALNATGFDIDNCRDPVSGIFTPFGQSLIDQGETYAEVSPSKTGVRFFADGIVPNAKCDAPQDGAEIYGANQYLTVTENHIPGTPTEIRPAPKTLALIRARIAEVNGSKGVDGGDVDPDKGLASLPNNTPWAKLNAAALGDLHAWVFELWPTASEQPNGALRVSSADLGRDLQEGLGFHPQGIRDHGREIGLTPINAILDDEICTPPVRDALEAAHWLCERLERRPEEFGFVKPKGKAKSTPKKPTLIRADELYYMKFAPVRFVVPGYIAEGLSLFAGRPKLGKSWLMYDTALAVASGGLCLGAQCRQGDVLYLSLEDNPRRLQDRLHKLWGEQVEMGASVPSRLTVTTEWPRANEGGLEAIEEWIVAHPDAALVIVDVLARFRATGKAKDVTQYDADYQAVSGLQQIALKHGVAIIVVHHVKKSDGLGDDPIEKVSGTLGLSGAADTILVLDKKAGNVTLYGRGRDIEEIDSGVIFDPNRYRWQALGNSRDVRRADERNVILDALTDNKDGLSPSELAAATGMKANNVRQLLFKMSRANEVECPKRGLYCLPGGEAVISFEDALSLPTDNNDNNGNESNKGGGRRAA